MDQQLIGRTLLGFKFKIATRTGEYELHRPVIEKALARARALPRKKTR